MNKKRILLKLSGESFKGDLSFGQDLNTIIKISQDIIEAKNSGVEVCVVIGGGNIFRGAALIEQGFEKVSSDYIGMLATIMNAIALQRVISNSGVKSKVFSSLHVDKICTPYVRDDAMQALTEGYINIFAGGTGNPFVTTDTAAAIKAIEMRCDLLVKGTQVDGVYDSDPKQNSHAKKYSQISYEEVLEKKIKIMDFAAISLANEQKLPILVFNISKSGELKKVINGLGNFTLIQ